MSSRVKHLSCLRPQVFPLLFHWNRFYRLFLLSPFYPCFFSFTPSPSHFLIPWINNKYNFQKSTEHSVAQGKSFLNSPTGWRKMVTACQWWADQMAWECLESKASWPPMYLSVKLGPDNNQGSFCTLTVYYMSIELSRICLHFIIIYYYYYYLICLHFRRKKKWEMKTSLHFGN